LVSRMGYGEHESFGPFLLHAVREEVLIVHQNASSISFKCLQKVS
jgi:hypothetical protein